MVGKKGVFSLVVERAHLGMARANYSEPAYPPLFPPGFSEITVEALESRFVAPGFDTPLRRRLTVQLRAFVMELARLGVHGDIWIDGSYATRKPDPHDVDVVLSITPAALQTLADENRDQLGYYSDKDGRPYVRRKWQVDFYIMDATNHQRHGYYQRLFSNNPDQSNRKGIPFIRL